MKLFGRNKRNKKTRRATTSTRRDALPRGLKDLAAQGKVPAGGFRGGDPAGLAFVLAIAMVVAGVALFRVWTRSETQRLGYAIVAAEARLRVAQSEHARLTVEEATLSSPVRIARVATERLGLRVPEPEQIVDLRGLPGNGAAEETELALAVPERKNARP